jgi:hypothetical protein
MVLAYSQVAGDVVRLERGGAGRPHVVAHRLSRRRHRHCRLSQPTLTGTVQSVEQGQTPGAGYLSGPYDRMTMTLGEKRNVETKAHHNLKAGHQRV